MSRLARTPLSFLSILTTVFLLACGGSQTPVSSDDARSEDSKSDLVRVVNGDNDEVFTPFALQHLGGVDAPQVESGDSPQATNFAFKDDLAFVSYNSAGSSSLGGVEVFDISLPSKPSLLHSHLFEGAEFSSVAVKGRFVYLAGANREGALLRVVERDEILEADPTWYDIVLDGYVATDVYMDGPKAVVTVGDNLGVVEVELSDPSRPVVTSTYALQNAHSALRFRGQTFALGGEDSLSVFQTSRPEPVFSVVDEVMEGPIRALTHGNQVFINPNHEGLFIFDVRDLAKPSLSSHFFVEGTGNGLDKMGNVLYLAQGEAGVHLMDIQDEDDPIYLGRLDFEDNFGSANQVRVFEDGEDKLVFVADGRGGFQIIRWSPKISVEASKFYGPSRWEDGILDIPGEALVKIPASIAVIEGNAGNHWLDVYFGDIHCRYRGGADQARPREGTGQWKKGLIYHRPQCDGGLPAGEAIFVERRIRVSVANGHSQKAVTRVLAEFEVLR